MGQIPQRPTVRLGAVSLGVEGLSREILVKNTSSVEASVEWRVVSSEKVCEDLSATPPEEALGLEVALSAGEGLEVKAGAQLSLPILLKPSALSLEEDQQEFHWLLLGRIVPKDPVLRLKPSYFLRQPACLRVEVTATLVQPQLQVEMLSDSPVRIYANQVTLERCSSFPLECLLKNPTPSALEVELQCSEPLALGPTGPKVRIAPRQCRKVQLECLLSYEKILRWASQVYRSMEAKEVATPRGSVGTEVKLHPGEERMVEEEHKVLTLHRKLTMYFGGGAEGGDRMVMPIDIMIYYPHIQVKPAHVKFDYVLLGRTQKAILTIYNLTGKRTPKRPHNL
uniref:Uncharacterized protein n=1 Tax=Dendroctonus ponderosae TaxID=77166 RepID=A0AAR5Q685_DENPD